MDINATLLGQMITFALFVAFTMKFVWPPVMAALKERQAKISEGLAAAERGRHEEELAKRRSVELMKEHKERANEIMEKAKHQADKIVEEAKHKAELEKKRILESAEVETQQVRRRMQDELRKEIVSIALVGAEKVLTRSVDEAANRELLNDFIESIG